jgi:hypothetical protein
MGVFLGFGDLALLVPAFLATMALLGILMLVFSKTVLE